MRRRERAVYHVASAMFLLSPPSRPPATFPPVGEQKITELLYHLVRGKQSEDGSFVQANGRKRMFAQANGRKGNVKAALETIPTAETSSHLQLLFCQQHNNVVRLLITA